MRLKQKSQFTRTAVALSQIATLAKASSDNGPDVDLYTVRRNTERLMRSNHDYGRYKNDFRYLQRPPLDADGKELIYPIAVNDRTSALEADRFFKAVNYYVSQYKSLHNVPSYIYQATYSGAPTSYWTPPDTDTKKGWNVIISTDGIQITWEGSMSTCVAIDNSNAVSNVGCTFENANEYCHRHGGELFLPDEYYWDHFFRPMCSDLAGPNSGANKYNAKYSNVNYWINMRRTQQPQNFGRDLFNMQTSASIHFFNRLTATGKFPIYTGWNATNQVVNEPEHFATRYINMFDQELSTEEIKNAEHHDLLAQIQTDPNTGQKVAVSRLGQSMTDHVSSMDGTSDLNMAYISRHLAAQGLVSQQCMILECNSDSPIPKVQDYACDHNNVRPLCVMKDIFQFEKSCPVEVDSKLRGEGWVTGFNF